MLLKISLGLAILVGLATLYFTHVQVAGKIDTLNTTITTVTSEKETALQAQAKAQEEAKKSRTALDATSKELGLTTNLLSQVTKDLDQQRRRADLASSNVVVITEERNEARQELNKWKILSMEPEKIRGELEAKKKLEEQTVAQREENRLLSGKAKDLQKRLLRYEPAGAEPTVPPGTKAKVVAYDFKYNFVVLDIGSKQVPNLQEGATMLINRDGHLVTKVKITRIDDNRTIANIMPEWRMEEPMEGDLAISAN